MPEQNSILTVSEMISKNPNPQGDVKPSHWVDDTGTSFRNPWESYRHHTFMNLLSVSKPRIRPNFRNLTVFDCDLKVYVKVPIHDE